MRNIGPEDPREVGGYRILRVLGAGGMGRVYVGRSRSGRIVAVKVVLPGLAEDPGFRGRFRREVDAARRVGVTWTAPVLDADPEAEQPWLVTGYVAGLSLSEAVALHGPLPGDAVRTLSAGLAEALGGIHEAGVVHRDLKPSNVMLSLDGPRVIDFGISRAADASVLTRTGMTVGSPGFMSPEQIEGSDIGPPTDVFSLGAVLTFAATGAGPFGEGDAQALLFRILTQEPRLHALPEWLRPVIAACLAKNPADRPTPSDVLTAVAPAGGTSELVAGGWLPPDLITAVSRRAIALLELEDEPDGVPATAPDLTAADARKPAAPPITEPNPGAPPPLAPTSGDDAVRPEHAATVPVPPPTAGTVYVPPPPAPGGAPAPESVASTPPPTAFAPPPQADRRRTPWPYVVAVVTVVAIAVVAVVLLIRSDGDGSGPAAQSQTTGTGAANPGTAPAGAGNPTASPNPTGTGPLPSSYTGTWQGTAVTSAGLVTHNITVTLRSGNTGQVVGSSSDDFTMSGVGFSCAGDSKLAAVDATGARFEDVPGPGAPSGLCVSGGGYTLRPLPDGKMAYTAYGPGSDDLAGTLTKKGA